VKTSTVEFIHLSSLGKGKERPRGLAKDIGYEEKIIEL